MTDLTEPPATYQPDRRKGTWQAPAIPPGDVRRIREAAHIFRTVLPPAVGLIVYRDLIDWCEHGQRYGGGKLRLDAADEAEAMYRDKALGRTYG